MRVYNRALSDAEAAALYVSEASNIVVSGNGTIIPNGDTSPSTVDHTDFGTGGPTVDRTFTIANTGTALLTLGTASFSGTNAADFAIQTPPAATVAAGGSTTLVVRFTPSASGLRSATLTLPSDNATNGSYFFAIQGGSAGVGALDVPEIADLGITGTEVRASALQPDGKMLIGGLFTVVGGAAHNRIARLNANGTLDTSFNPDVNNTVNCIAVMPDGKIIIGGFFTSVNGTTRNRVARLKSDGTLDTGFDPNADAEVYCLAPQPDGSILLGGDFLNVGGLSRSRVARLTTSGVPDSLATSVNGRVRCIALQADGKIYLGGTFTTVNSVARWGTVRLLADGGIDGTFSDPLNALANGNVHCLSLLPNGHVLLGGSFDYVDNYTTLKAIARLDNAGDADVLFAPNMPGGVYSLAPRADGGLIAAGPFQSCNGSVRKGIATISGTATLETSFDPGISGDALGVMLQGDGKALLAGSFTTMQPGGGAGNTFTRSLFTRVQHSASATQTISFPNTAWAQWTRGGGAPLVEQVSFELSTNGGATYTAVAGTISRIGTTSGWQITGATLPVSGLLRARGRVAGGRHNSSSGIIEQVINYSGVTLPPEIALSGNGSAINHGATSTSTTNHTQFGSVNANSGSITRTFTVSNSGTGVLNLTGTPRVTISGTHAGDFTVTTQPAASVAVSGSTTFQVTFDPSAQGVRNATVTLTNNDLDESSFSFAVAGSGAGPDIAVLGQVLGNFTFNIPNGYNTSTTSTSFGYTTTVAAPPTLSFLLSNQGNAVMNLTGSPRVQVLGAQAADFSIVSQPAATLAAGSSATLQVRWAPLTPGNASATISIPSDDPDENPFTFTVFGTCLSPANDTDGDGLNDVAEFQMSTLGFNWQSSQTALVQTLTSNLHTASYYNQSQLQQLNVGTPVLVRNNATGTFKLSFGLQQSSNLVNFTPLPFTSGTTTINGSGQIEFEFTPGTAPSFYRVGAQ
ncbi:MAG: choice-of-anchor D domain-containing protein [Verrucomicrobiaceae bacterium]|nr:choice-of-anchor D domain-containing protein [Verrucomicrobiaceae bacterium]